MRVMNLSPSGITVDMLPREAALLVRLLRTTPSDTPLYYQCLQADGPRTAHEIYECLDEVFNRFFDGGTDEYLRRYNLREDRLWNREDGDA